MIRTKTKKDSHGLYVRTNGSIYRPVVSEFSYMFWQGTSESKLLDARLPVKVAAIRQAPLCRIQFGIIKEVWSLHGGYVNEKLKEIKSEEVWRPFIKK